MSAVKKTHHKKEDVATNRPGYREARWERAVKVYTVNQESQYLLVQNVHALGVTQELLQLFALYGAIQEYRLLDEYPSEPYTDVYWIKFSEIDSARVAKRKTDNHSFFGKNLHVCYAPEFESVQDTREKLQQRRKIIAAKTRDKAHRPLEQEQSQASSIAPTNPPSNKSPTLDQGSVPGKYREHNFMTVPSSLLEPASSQSSIPVSIPILPTPPIMDVSSYPSMERHVAPPSSSYPVGNNESAKKSDTGTQKTGNYNRKPQQKIHESHKLEPKKGLSSNERLSLYVSLLNDSPGEALGVTGNRTTSSEKQAKSTQKIVQQATNNPSTKKRRRI